MVGSSSRTTAAAMEIADSVAPQAVEEDGEEVRSKEQQAPAQELDLLCSDPAMATAGSGEKKRAVLFKCDYCLRMFYSLQALGGHQNAHRRERSLARQRAAAARRSWYSSTGVRSSFTGVGRGSTVAPLYGVHRHHQGWVAHGGEPTPFVYAVPVYAPHAYRNGASASTSSTILQDSGLKGLPAGAGTGGVAHEAKHQEEAESTIDLNLKL